MTTYAAQKGRAKPAPAVVPTRPAAPLSAADEAAIEANKRFIQQHMPDFVPFLRDLREIGYADGWRNVVRTKLLDGGQDE